MNCHQRSLKRSLKETRHRVDYVILMLVQWQSMPSNFKAYGLGLFEGLAGGNELPGHRVEYGILMLVESAYRHRPTSKTVG